MIPLHEHESLLRKLVFHADLAINRQILARPVLLLPIDRFNAVSNFQEVVACSYCDEPFKPFSNLDDKLVWLTTGCTLCFTTKVWAGEQSDLVLDKVSELLVAKVYQQKFDVLCAEHPLLIQESYAYSRCLQDWIAMYDELRVKYEALKRERNQLPPTPPATN